MEAQVQGSLDDLGSDPYTVRSGAGTGQHGQREPDYCWRCVYISEICSGTEVLFHCYAGGSGVIFNGEHSLRKGVVIEWIWMDEG